MCVCITKEDIAPQSRLILQMPPNDHYILSRLYGATVSSLALNVSPLNTVNLRRSFSSVDVYLLSGLNGNT